MAAFLLTAGLPSLADTSPGLAERFDERLDSIRAELIELRRDLHRHPEVSENERRTAEVVAACLEGLGLWVKTGVGGHGVAAIRDDLQGSVMLVFQPA